MISGTDTYFPMARHDACSGRYMTASDNYNRLPERWENQISSWQCTDIEAVAPPPGDPDAGESQDPGRNGGGRDRPGGGEHDGERGRRPST